MRILITGGAGFIGSALVRHLLQHSDDVIANVDCLSYAGNLQTLESVTPHPRYTFYQSDVTDSVAMKSVFNEFQPDAIMHLAAESHVDRSINGAAPFIHTNIVGTYVLLETARQYWLQLPTARQKNFRFHHVSTDEVYGDLGHTEALFTEQTPYAPSSPYSASKASADHLVRAWHRTYGLPILISNCSNNYGPYQFPEKLIPRMIMNALTHQPLPVYGDGQQIRDWLYVDDHVRALQCVLKRGQVGQTYNIGAHQEQSNIAVIKQTCQILDELQPWPSSFKASKARVRSYQELIEFVDDRPGHDIRYAIDASKIKNELGWRPTTCFSSGLRQTVQWYLAHPEWGHTI